MSPKIYAEDYHPAYGAIAMCVKATGIKVKFVLEGEHVTPYINLACPNQLVPYLEEDDIVYELADSHAIMGYLIGTYGRKKYDSLYPRNDVRRRALIDQALYFNSGVLQPKGIKIAELMTENQTPLDDIFEELSNMFSTLDKQIQRQNSKYIVGNYLSIADFSIISSVMHFGFFLLHWQCRFPHLNAYIERMAKEQWFDAVSPSVAKFRDAMIGSLGTLDLDEKPALFE